MLTLKIGGKSRRIDDANPLGQGGEACVYDLGDGTVCKVFRRADDPMYAGDRGAQQTAAARVREYSEKLAAFPKGMPDRVIAPIDLAHDTRGALAGFTMRFLPGGEVFASYGQPKFRRSVPMADVAPVLLDLHATVGAVHAAAAVIGDFNDLNVLVKGHEAFLIDADSFQFSANGQTWHCRTYTGKFGDPLVCTPAPSTGAPVLTKPHTSLTDWYAFAVMVAQTWLCTDPYGGVYVAPPGGPKIAHAARSMHRIPVWHKDVRYPRPASSLNRLSDEMMEHLHRVFERDQRETFPLALLRTRWTTCSACGTEHARPVCPQQGCQTAAPAVKPVTTTVQVRGTVTATSVYRGGGRILRAEVHGGKVLWLAHDGGRLVREDGSVVVAGDPARSMRYRVIPAATIIAQGPTAVRLDKPPASAPRGTSATAHKPFTVATVDGAPVLGATEHHTYWIDGDVLYRDEPGTGLLAGAHTRVGNVVAGQTRVWVGDQIGFGFSRAHVFVFDPRGRGIRDGVQVHVCGKLVDATCVIANTRAWFLTQTQEGPRQVNRARLIRADGTVEAAAETDAGDGSWLGGIRGGCAVGNILFMPTDAGIVRVEARGMTSATNPGDIEATKMFPDTEPWVNQGCQLLMGSDGIYVVSEDRLNIVRLVMS